jgi:hypothetical protein
MRLLIKLKNLLLAKEENLAKPEEEVNNNTFIKI